MVSGPGADELSPDPEEPRPSGIGRASALLASGTLVSRILGFVKSLVLAAAIGQVGSVAANAFTLSTQLPNNIYALVAGGLLGAILVPQIVRAGLHSDGGQKYIDKIITLGTVAFVAIAAIGTIAAPFLVALYARADDSGRGFSAAGIALATAFAYWCLPQVFFYALYSLLGQILNARKAFGAFTWAPVVNNVVALIGLVIFMLVFGDKSTNSDAAEWDAGRIALLAGTATLGVAAQALILTLFWKRAGLSFRPDFHWRGVGLRRTGVAAGWTFGMILVTQLAGIAQSQIASIAATNDASLTALLNSWLIFMLPHSVIAVSIATAYFTRMSGHATGGDFAAVRNDVSSSLRNIGVLIVFASVGLIVVAFPFARLFESTFTGVTAMALVIISYAVGLVPFSAVFVLQRVFFALEDTRTPFFIELVKAGVFTAGAVSLLAVPPEWIGVGIALSTSVACVVQFTLTYLLLRRRLGALGGRLLLRRHVQFAVAAAAAGIVGIGILVSLGGLADGGFAQSAAPSAVIAMATIGAGMAVVYFAVLLLMRSPEAHAALDRVVGRFRRN